MFFDMFNVMKDNSSTSPGASANGCGAAFGRPLRVSATERLECRRSWTILALELRIRLLVVV